MKRLVTLSVLSFICSISVFAQYEEYRGGTLEERTARAKDAINALHDGYLVVRLNSRAKNIDKLEGLIASEKVSDKRKKYLQKLLQIAKDERDFENNLIIESIHEHYDFSAVFFIYDYNFEEFKKGKRKGIFVNQQLKIDPNIFMIAEASWMLMYVGYTPSTDGARVYSYIHENAKGEFMKVPFPDINRRFPTQFKMRLFKRRYEKNITNWNTRLHLFYQSLANQKEDMKG